MTVSRKALPTLARIAMLAGISAFVVALVLQLSIWPSFECQRYMIRSEMKSRLLRCVPQEDLVVFRFTPAEYADLDFEDGGRELELNGAMHDIVRTVCDADGMILVQVVRDEAETALLASLDKRVRKVQEADTRGHQQRRVLASMWAGFHEAVPVTIFRLPGTERIFPEERHRYGRVADGEDHGPPRRA